MHKTSLKILALSFIFLTFSFNAVAQEGIVIIDQDSDIEKLLEYKKDIRSVDVYKIQIDQGSRAFAEKLKAEFLNSYGQWPVSMEYNTPNYKIWVGNFRSRIEADRALLKIKRKYIKAFIFMPKKYKK